MNWNELNDGIGSKRVICWLVGVGIRKIDLELLEI